MAAKTGHEVFSAADYLGIEPRLLEARRERLYEEDPPTEEFSKWTQLRREKRREQPPPI